MSTQLREALSCLFLVWVRKCLLIPHCPNGPQNHFRPFFFLFPPVGPLADLAQVL